MMLVDGQISASRTYGTRSWSCLVGHLLSTYRDLINLQATMVISMLIVYQLPNGLTR